jgi:hypothetical protein
MHHDMIIFICIITTYFITASIGVCVVESTSCLTMVGPNCVSIHKTSLYQMHLDDISILLYNFVVTVKTQTTYLHRLANASVLLRSLDKL